MSSEALRRVPLTARVDIHAARCPRCGSKLVWGCGPRHGDVGYAHCAAEGGSRMRNDGLPAPCGAPGIAAYRSLDDVFVSSIDLRGTRA